ncbi:tRNA lysidine(34) synthetase TilS [Nostocoides sp. Soil756]|jgi:tRNA(Ile)-lysidine synthase|uniref:tRNA lysidine(34) synthetase TilS n=1 Tax=Nostocoides sp. Soil756 TaxID=1736399 RepID=UPI0006F25C94|nr:tRNA lysidine(34) synthetase TilS [Tetrasphaera sp. Soil756]KRE60883.1 tRNA(Ile)-lysidine synthetase [Tetrasphaera sp. Soil756]
MTRAWGRPHPAVAAVRSAVRAALAECDPGDLALVACSGGADSLALADAARQASGPAGVRVGAVVVDHGLQGGSREVADTVGRRLADLGLDPVQVVSCPPTGPGGGSGGLEAAARAARYRALDAAADEHGARLVLLGHTRDDQAEQVLLGLARGSGARSLAGMPPARGRYRRPLLVVTRAQTRAACAAEGLTWWDDPMNEDPAFARVRARRALADLEAQLGPGLGAALARSAAQLREDADHLDTLADGAVAGLGAAPWRVEALAALPRAVRTRTWRRLLVAAGAPAGQLSSRHTDACDRLLTHWHGQGAVHVPGGLRVRRSGGRVSIARPDRVD